MLDFMDKSAKTVLFIFFIYGLIGGVLAIVTNWDDITMVEQG